MTLAAKSQGTEWNPASRVTLGATLTIGFPPGLDPENISIEARHSQDMSREAETAVGVGRSILSPGNPGVRGQLETWTGFLCFSSRYPAKRCRAVPSIAQNLVQPAPSKIIWAWLLKLS